MKICNATLFYFNHIFQALEVFISKAFKDAAVVFYCKFLITQKMNTSGAPAR